VAPRSSASPWASAPAPSSALAVGLPAGHFRSVRRAVEPVVELLRPIPPLAMLPLFIVWIGIGEESKIGFITYATFFPMFLTTVHAVRRIDPLPRGARAQSLGARPRQLFFRVLPASGAPRDPHGHAPRAGAVVLRQSVISEFIGAEHGLGYLINDGRNFFLVPQMLGAAVVLARPPRLCRQRAGPAAGASRAPLQHPA